MTSNLNTRAVQDVPELVRYDWCRTRMMVEVGRGEYVLYEQAVAVIAAERQAAIDARNLLQYEKDQQWRERAEAAEAELATLKEINANLMGDDEDKPRYTTKRLKYEIEKVVKEKLDQIKSQEPVAYRYRHSEQEKWHYGETDQYWWEHQPLYAAPIASYTAPTSEAGRAALTQGGEG